MEASKAMLKGSRDESEMTAGFLVPPILGVTKFTSTTSYWGTLHSKIGGGNSATRDRRQDHLSNIKRYEAYSKDLPKGAIRDSLPLMTSLEVPLLDSLINCHLGPCHYDTPSMDTLKTFASLRSYAAKTNIESRVIRLGALDQEVTLQTLAWARKEMEQDKLQTGMNVVAIYTDTIELTNRHIRKLTEQVKGGNKFPIELKDSYGSTRPFLCKLSIGNGTRWSLTIEMACDKEGQRLYPAKMSKVVSSFLEHCPATMLTEDLRRDLTLLQEFILVLTAREELGKPIEMFDAEAVMRVLGMASYERDMPSLACHTLGMVYPSGSMGLENAMVPAVNQTRVYVMHRDATLRVLYSSMCVAFANLTYKLCPDASAVCVIGDMSQESLVSLMFELVKDVLTNVCMSFAHKSKEFDPNHQERVSHTARRVRLVQSNPDDVRLAARGHEQHLAGEGDRGADGAQKARRREEALREEEGRGAVPLLGGALLERAALVVRRLAHARRARERVDGPGAASRRRCLDREACAIPREGWTPPMPRDILRGRGYLAGVLGGDLRA